MVSMQVDFTGNSADLPGEVHPRGIPGDDSDKGSVSTGRKKRVIFICTYNSVRSQMAEGILRHMYGDSYEVASGGIAPAGVHPLAVTVLKERGVDISNQKSRSVMQFRDQHFDFIVTLCDDSKYKCTLPLRGTRMIHRPFPCPPELAEDPSVIMTGFRSLRDEIWKFIEITFRPQAPPG